MGVGVQFEEKKIKCAGSLYSWAHERYSLLEEDYDSWIGDDNSQGHSFVQHKSR